MESLRRLVLLPEWAAYQKAIEAAYEFKVASLMDCSSFEQYREVLGCLKAYDEVFKLNDLVVGKADTLDEYRRNTAERDRATRDAERATLIASRLWTPSGVPVQQ